MPFKHTRQTAGEEVDLKIHRDGQETSVRYPLCIRNNLVPILHGVECLPEYFIVGGVVFIPLSYPFLEHAFGTLSSCSTDDLQCKWRNSLSQRMALSQPPSITGKEIRGSGKKVEVTVDSLASLWCIHKWLCADCKPENAKQLLSSDV